MKKNVPYRSLMSAALTATVWLAATVVFATPLDIDQVEVYPSTGDENSVCQYRLDYSLADCLSASWDNSGRGSSFEVTSECSAYGDVYARLNAEVEPAPIEGYTLYNTTYVLRNGDTFSQRLEWANVTGWYCCRGPYLCNKSQVEQDANGMIVSVSISAGGVTETEVDVSTYPRRFAFCEENPHDIYCIVDPEGDANRANCTDHACGIDDCTANWVDSQASDFCRAGSTGDGITFVDGGFDFPQCSLSLTCQVPLAKGADMQPAADSFETTTLVSEVADLTYCTSQADNTVMILTRDTTECMSECPADSASWCIAAP